MAHHQECQGGLTAAALPGDGRDGGTVVRDRKGDIVYRDGDVLLEESIGAETPSHILHLEYLGHRCVSLVFLARERRSHHLAGSRLDIWQPVILRIKVTGHLPAGRRRLDERYFLFAARHGGRAAGMEWAPPREVQQLRRTASDTA